MPSDFSAFATAVTEGQIEGKERENPALYALGREAAGTQIPRWEELVQPGLSTIVVAGSVDPGDLAAARELTKQAGERMIPVIAEPTSGLCDCETWIPHSPWVIEMCGAQVEQILVLGKPTLPAR